MNDPGADDCGSSSPSPSSSDRDRVELDRIEESLAALGVGERPSGGDVDYAALLAVLADWRRELGSAPLPELPGDEEIAVALASNVAPLRPRRGWAGSREHHHGQRPALWQAVIGAAAVAAVLVGGLSVAAHGAFPGDPLWGVSKSIFSDRAGDVQLVSDLGDHLSAADAAARQGDRYEATRLLDEVTGRLDEVTDASERVELMKRRDVIRRGLSRVTPTSVPSPAPAPPPVAPAPGAATLVPGTSVQPAPVRPRPVLPTAPTGVPVIPLPLDGLRIPTTLQIPVDPQRIQDFLSPTTGRPPMEQQTQTPEPQRTTVTSVPTSPRPTVPTPTPTAQAPRPTR